MDFLKLKIFFWCFVPALSCENKEKEAILQTKYFVADSFFIQSVDGIFDQTFDLKNLFELLEFTDQNHTLPFIMDTFRLPHEMTSYENQRNLSWVTKNFRGPSGTNIVLYGCSIFKKKPARIVLFDPYMYTLNEVKTRVPPEIPEEKKTELKRCQEEANLFIAGCLRLVDDVEKLEKMIFIIFVFVGMSILAICKCDC